jgi:murein L,D-transpeptidase YcbB/YkuD
VVENGSEVMNTAIVGKTDKRTHLLSTGYSSNEPSGGSPGIAVEEYLPKLPKKPGYLSGKN